jgi:hypothetical protein
VAVAAAEAAVAVLRWSEGDLFEWRLSRRDRLRVQLASAAADL